MATQKNKDPKTLEEALPIIAELQKNAEQSAAANATLTEQLATATAANKQAGKDNAALTKQNEGLTEKVAELKGELEQAEEVNDELQKQLNEKPAASLFTVVQSSVTKKKYEVRAKSYFDPILLKKIDVATGLVGNQERINALEKSGSTLLKEIK